ncbi:hypothetical protein CISG_03684 [Coccidioides immitis RMSCC 3703]|uniref:Uncharacterized protein n=1 Tax=Coccidioides immitis RMSCC 3703 TaxID=454286 RepID=A0A0J8QML1_COCIT|nr:hypothetical protein CISG_03684 [Coccidioides immitis RMSCC 3703]
MKLCKRSLCLQKLDQLSVTLSLISKAITSVSTKEDAFENVPSSSSCIQLAGADMVQYLSETAEQVLKADSCYNSNDNTFVAGTMQPHCDQQHQKHDQEGGQGVVVQQEDKRAEQGNNRLGTQKQQHTE